MKKYEVTVRSQQISTRRWTKDELIALSDNELKEKYDSAMWKNGDDTPSEEYKFSSKDEANYKFKELIENTVSHYWWGNELLDITMVCLEEVEYDEDGDYVDSCAFNYHICEIR